MNILRPFRSPNTDFKVITVQFLVLHYTGCSLDKTLSIFKDAKKKVSAHFVIGRDGDVYEIIPCLDKRPLKAFHAGKSFWKSFRGRWENFNNISVGIELVNNNGNIFPYTKQQYKSLAELVQDLKVNYPLLEDPHRVLGHEHISGFRGKVDPGVQFKWSEFFKQAYPKEVLWPQRKPVLPLELKDRFFDLTQKLDSSEKDWSRLSTLLEKQYLHYLKTE